MNATIHGFTSFKDVNEYFLRFTSMSSGRLGFEIRNVIKEQMEALKTHLDLSKLRESLNSEAPHFNKPDPQDSQEYVTHVYNSILKNYPDCPLRLTQFNLLSKAIPENNKHVDILRLVLPPGTKKNDVVDFDEVLAYNLSEFIIDHPPKYMIINMQLDEKGLKKEVNLNINFDDISFTPFLKDQSANVCIFTSFFFNTLLV
jgi:hypothetical protein